MRLRNIALAGIVLLALTFTAGTGLADTNGTADQANVTDNNTNISDEHVLVDDIAPDEPLIGPGHALYGLSIAWEHLGMTFTINPEERLGKQIAQARQRIAEAKAKLNKNDFKNAEIALERYQEEMDEANETISRISDNAGLLNEQLKIAKHQYVLGRLLNQTPNSTGLQRAYDNSLNLERKFSERTKHEFKRISRGEHEFLKDEHEESEDDETTKIKAEITDNGSKVEIKVKFMTDSTNETDIAADTVTELQKLQNNLSELLKLEQDDGEANVEEDDDEATVDVTGTPTGTLTAAPRIKQSEEYKDKLDVKAKVRKNVTEVNVEYMFRLDATDRDSIINGIENKLSGLTPDTVLKALKIEGKEEEHKVTEKKSEMLRNGENSGRKEREDRKDQGREQD